MKHRTAARIVLVAGALLLAVALGGCGVPVDQGPTALSRAGVPFHLLSPSSPSTTATTVPSPVEVPVDIYLFDPSGDLVAVPRAVPSATQLLEPALVALVGGPTQAEVAAGDQSAIPPQTTVLSTSVAGGIATANLGGSFAQLVGQAQIEAVAQVVYTATGLSSVDATEVSFELNGQPVEVPVANGAQVPVANRADFATFAPPAPTSGPAS
ncbi:MAG TPA: GerMN domain-containing protein [Acidimicrobiales bacterium]|nr:GerMN domain-containing protein [Acidimicrobiales bacterium]